MEKRHRRGLAVSPHRFLFRLSPESVGNFESVRNARRSLTAGAQRPSERGGVISSDLPDCLRTR
jgi:hypothetical protein